MIRTVHGTEFDGGCSTLTIGKTEIPFASFSYGDNVDKELVYQSGSQMPVARTPGQYKPADGKLKLRSTVARKLLFSALAKHGASNSHTIAVVTYSHLDIGKDSDALHFVTITGGSASVEASAKQNEIEIPILYLYVAWTDKRIVFGNFKGAGASQRMRL